VQRVRAALAPNVASIVCVTSERPPRSAPATTAATVAVRSSAAACAARMRAFAPIQSERRYACGRIIFSVPCAVSPAIAVVPATRRKISAAHRPAPRADAVTVHAVSSCPTSCDHPVNAVTSSTATIPVGSVRPPSTFCASTRSKRPTRLERLVPAGLAVTWAATALATGRASLIP